MSRTDELLAEVMKLPLEERRLFVEQLVESLPVEESGDPLDDPEFLEELERRFQDGTKRVPESDLWKRIPKS